MTKNYKQLIVGTAGEGSLQWLRSVEKINGTTRAMDSHQKKTQLDMCEKKWSRIKPGLRKCYTWKLTTDSPVTSRPNCNVLELSVLTHAPNVYRS